MRRSLVPRALAALGVPLLLAASATSLRAPQVSHQRDAGAPPSISRTEVMALRASRGAPRTPLAPSPQAEPVTTTTAPPPPVPRKVRPARGAITGRFGERRRGHIHPGLDIDGNTGDPVVAAMAGTVVVAGPAPSGYGGYGNIVVIDHGGGVRTLYAHLSRVGVRAGQALAAGQWLGAIGSTGQSSGSHLHFEVEIGGRRVDPAAWLGQP